MLDWRVLVGISIVSLLVSSPAGISVTKPAGPAGGDGTVSSPVTAFIWGPASTHLQHVITVVMENRDYDNYFGVYCQTLGPYCSSTGNGIPAGMCVPYNPTDLLLGCVSPFNFTAQQFVTTDLPHDWVSGPTAWNHGGMNDFYLAENRGTTPFGHFNGSTLPIYWDMAEQYASSDNFFAANLSYSLPNHWDLVAGGAPNITEESYIKSSTDRATYLTEANETSTVADLLNVTKVSWKYYDYALPNHLQAVISAGDYSAYDYWNPFAGKTESYFAPYVSHFAPRGDLLTDIANGTLPQLSWVIPSANVSDHPGFNLTRGEAWVSQIVNSVENSSYWNSTAIFVIWDDYGGWYDHVAPPRVGPDLLSFRSPILVISPFARENYISHTFLDFYSLLHFDEWVFNLGCNGPVECGAPLPLDFFDFNQTARQPMLFPTDWTQATYPMALQRAAVHPIPCPSCTTLISSDWNEGAPDVGMPGLGD
jgi:phospholipase C